MSNPTLFLAQLNGSLAFQDRAGGGTLTSSGAMRYAPASGARINLCTNPSFETNTSGWAALGGGGNAIARITTDASRGSACLQVTSTGAGGGGYYGFGVTSARINGATQYRLSFDAKSVSGDNQISLSWYETNATATAAIGGQQTIQNGVTLTSSWARYSYTFTTTRTGTHGIFLYMASTNSAGVYLIDGVVLEVASGSSATDYFDGSTGGVWLDPITGILGTAHASPSVSQAVGWVEEGTTNGIADPQATNATPGTYWNANAAGTTTTKDTTYAYIGSSSLKIVCDGTLASQGISYNQTTSIAATNGQAWTASVWARGSGTVLLIISERSVTGTELATGSSSTTVLTDQWQRLTYTRTNTNASTAYITMKVVHSPATAATFYATNFQLEQKAYATSYCDGAIGTGYAWSGTAHASSSTRTGANISRTSVPAAVVNTVRGSMATRWSPIAANSPSQGKIIQAGGTGGTGDHLSITAANATGIRTGTQFWARVNAGSFLTTTDGTDLALEQWYSPYMQWNGTAVDGLRDLAATFVSFTRDSPTGSLAGSDIRIGCGAAAEQINGYIGPVAIFDRPLTARERARLNARTQWAWTTLRERNRIIPGP